jgi:hypothetical protein
VGKITLIMVILLSQKNTLFELIEHKKFSQSQFKFNEYSGHIRIEFTNTNFYFNIGQTIDEINFYPQYSPAESTVKIHGGNGNWGHILIHFQKWLTFLNRETTIQDKWERLMNETANIYMSTESPELKFSAEEYELLKSRMISLKIEFGKIGLNQVQSTTLENKIDFLIDQAKHLNRFDWKSLFIGTIMSLIIQLSISQEQGKQIWKLIKEIFNNYFLP